MGKDDLKKWNKEGLNLLALDILKDYDKAMLLECKPLDIEAFIEEYLNLELDYKNLSQDGTILGLTTFDDGKIAVFSDERDKIELIDVRKGNIIIDNMLLENSPEGRIRFTLAHEMAHWILHRELFSNKINRSMYGSTDEVAVRSLNREDGELILNDNIKTKEEWIEWQADYLASAMLMPENIFRYHFYKILKEELDINKSYLYFDKQRCNIGNYNYVIGKLHSMFNVSKQAARIRLIKLNLLKVDDSVR